MQCGYLWDFFYIYILLLFDRLDPLHQVSLSFSVRIQGLVLRHNTKVGSWLLPNLESKQIPTSTQDNEIERFKLFLFGSRRFFSEGTRAWVRGHQTQSWRAGVLQSLAPTCLNTPACKFQVYLARPWLASSGVWLGLELNSAGHRLYRTKFGDLWHRSSTLCLGTHCPAKFISNLLRNTWPVTFQVILKTVISWLRCVWLGLELNSAGQWVPRSRVEDICATILTFSFDSSLPPCG